MRGTRWLLAATLGLILATPALAQRPEVVDLRFEGNDAFTADELASAIVTRESQCPNPVYQLLLLCWAGVGVESAVLDVGALEADAFRLRVYYYERGFREAQVEADTTLVDDNEVRVTFRIQEGRPVRVDAIDVSGLPDRIGRGSLPLQVGEPFDVVTYEATRDTLQARLWNNGFARGQVLLSYTILRESPYEATVQYDVYAGGLAHFGEIRVDGTEETSPDLVRRMLAFEEGDRYDRSALLRSQRNLYGLQIFRYADIQADLETMPDSVIPVTVQIAEGNIHQVRLGGGANTVECVNVEGHWTSRNFLGGGRRLTVRGRVGNLLMQNCGWLVNDDFADNEDLTGLASVDFTQPGFLGPRNSFGVGLFAERRNVPDVFVRTARGGYLSISRSMGGNAALTLAYRPELTELETENQLVFCVNFVACTSEPEIIARLRQETVLAPVALSYTVDQTDALFSPSRGFIIRLDVEHAASYTGSEFAYTRLLGESSQYLGEQGGLILATRIRAGIGFPHDQGGTEGLGLYPQKRFFAGGANSVRGFDQYRLGPTVLGIDAVPYLVNGDDASPAGAGCTMDQVNDGSCDAAGLLTRRFDVRPQGGEALLEGSVELRFPLAALAGSLRGALFVDAGQVWREGDLIKLSQVIATPGFGLRYRSPIGPLRVDAAFNTKGPEPLAVLTTKVEECKLGEDGCQRVLGRDPRALLRNSPTEVIDLTDQVVYGRGLDEIDSLRDFFSRFQLHFSIGQAF